MHSIKFHRPVSNQAGSLIAIVGAASLSEKGAPLVVAWDMRSKGTIHAAQLAVVHELCW